MRKNRQEDLDYIRKSWFPDHRAERIELGHLIWSRNNASAAAWLPQRVAEVGLQPPLPVPQVAEEVFRAIEACR